MPPGLPRSSAVRPLLLALSAILLLGCHRDRAAPIAADPTPSAKPAPPRAVQMEAFTSEGPPEVKLTWPRIDLPAGEAIAADLEVYLYKMASEFLMQTGHAGVWYFHSSCTTTLVAVDVVVVRCDHSASKRGREHAWVTTRGWLIDGGKARLLYALSEFGEGGLAAVAKVVFAQLEARGVTSVTDKDFSFELQVYEMETFAVDRQGLRFILSKRSATVHLDWKALRALAPHAELLVRLEAAARRPDSNVAADTAPVVTCDAGGPCNFAECKRGTISCATGDPTCVLAGNLADDSSCDRMGPLICRAGACVASPRLRAERLEPAPARPPRLLEP